MSRQLVKRDDKKQALIEHAQSSYRPHKRPKIVLEEDEYIHGLSKVIKRNYFPDLSEPQADSKGLSLAKYQAKYTSEDNADFLALLDSENLEKRERYAWHYNGNKVYSSTIQSRIDQEHEKKAVGWKVVPKNALMFDAEGIEVQSSRRSRVSPASTRLRYPISTEEVRMLSDELSDPQVRGFTFVDPETPRFEIPKTPRRQEVLDRITQRPEVKTQSTLRSRLSTHVTRTARTPRR